MPTGNRVIFRRLVEGNLLSSGNVQDLASIQQPFFEGIVVDVIVDETHPEYGVDGFNVGSAKIRLFSIDGGSSNGTLSWMRPIDNVIKQLPLIGEMVIVQDIQGAKYYSRSIAFSHRVQENAFLNINEQFLNDVVRGKIQQVLSSGQEIESTIHKFGQYFQPDSRVRQLKHFEGDTIIEGRMGHSIRLGSSFSDPSTDGMAPNIILRAGQGKNVPYIPSKINTQHALILEDINQDASSIWMVSDQTIPFVPSTSQAGSFVRSVNNPPQLFDKAQIIINSDRVVLNSKKENIMLFSNSEINLNSFGNTTVDTDGNIYLTANREINFKTGQNIESITNEDFMIFAGSDVISVALENTSIVSKKIFIGSTGNDVEPMVGGTSLSKFLARLIHALVNGETSEPPTSFTPGINQTNHIITPMGPGLLAPAVVSALETLYNELTEINDGQENSISNFSGAPFNSKTNFVMLQNQEPEIVKNEFKDGTQLDIERGEWLLNQNYYGVIE